MSLRTCLVFEASVTARSDADAPAPGREITASLVEGLQARFRVREPVSEHDSYGWYFVVEHEGLPVWCMLQLPGYEEPDVKGRAEWVVITEPRPSFFKRLSGAVTEPVHRAVCEELDRVVRRLPDLTKVRWCSKEEYEEGKGRGAEQP